jgi:hypothetical protein
MRTIVIIPAILLVIGCIVINASWYYYPIAVVAGGIIGLLALMTYYQIKKSE